MKKVTYLLLVMFATILLTTSCEKDEPVTPDTSDDGIMTLAQLDGQWNFESYLYDGIEFDTDNYLEYDNDYDDIEEAFKNLEFNTESLVVELTNVVYTSVYSEYDFTKTDNVLYIEGHVYTIVDYDGNILKLKWDAAAYSFDFEGGILTLTK